MRVSADKASMFCAPKAKKQLFLANFRNYALNLGTFSASAGGASKKFGAFYLQTVHDVIIFKFQGGASAPPCTPLPAPMSVRTVCVNVRTQKLRQRQPLDGERYSV